ncbi:hypothetical protein MauCBS54593_007588 [Microsporum audouinii]
MPPSTKPSMNNASQKPKQENINPRGEKRTADGTIKEQVEQVQPVDQAPDRAPNFLEAHNPDGQERELSEFSGGYETEGEFGADEMEEDDDDDDDGDDNDGDEGEDEKKYGKKDGDGKGSQRKPDRDFDPDHSNGYNGYNGDGGDDGYEGDTDNSGANTDFFGDCESNGDPVFEPDSEGETRNLDSIDPRTFGDIIFDTVESHMQTRVWTPDEDSQTLIENETGGHGLFQEDAFQYPEEGSSSSERIYYYNPNDFYYEESPEQTSEESDEEMNDNEDEDEEAEDEREEAAATPADDTLPGHHEAEYEYDTTHPYPIATEDMNTWYTDPVLADIGGHRPSTQPISGQNGFLSRQMATTHIQPFARNKEGIWEDTSEDEEDNMTTLSVMELSDIPSSSPVPEEENKENKYPQDDNLNMESEVETGVLEEALLEPASSNSQPWMSRYSPAEDREYRPISFGAALRPVPSLVGRVPVLNVNTNSPRTRVHEWYSRVGTSIQDVPEERVPTAGVVRRAYSPPSI